MSVGLENAFITSVHRHLPPSNELYRMKNHNQFNGGIADMWYSGGKSDLWIEYKFIKVPARASTVVDLISRPPKGDSVISSLQKEWLHGRHAEGRRVGVIVGSKDGGAWFPDLTWNELFITKYYLDRLCTRAELAAVIAQICL